MGVATYAVAVVDDEASVRTSLQRLLRAAGLSVTTFATGSDFMASLATGRPECVLLDIRMEGMDGFDVCARLAATGNCVPVILMTALEHGDDRTRAREVKAGFLSKPFTADELLEAIVAANRRNGS